MLDAKKEFPETPGQLVYWGFAREAARGAQALLLLTEWDEFRQLDLSRLKGLMELPVLVDGRNLFDPGTVRRASFEYISIGWQGANPGSEKPIAHVQFV
jgi:UDPglucose 6-dehydrogenase